MTRRRALIPAALGAVLVAVFAAGFGGKEEGRASKTVTFALAGIQSSLDPNIYQGRQQQAVQVGFQGSLVRYRPLQAGQRKLPGPTAILPELAQSWQRSGNSYVMTLRNVTSPAGNRLSAEDVKWTFERGIATDSVTRFLVGVTSMDARNPITVLDQRRFRINVTDPNILTLASLVWGGLSIYDSVEVRKHATAADPWAKAWLERNAASYGAFRIESFTPGQEVRLVKNARYWDAKNVKVDRLVYRAVADPGVELLLIRSGQVDVALDLPYNIFATARNLRNVKTIAALDTNADVMLLNLRDKLFQDVRVRRAINMALDRRAIIRSVYRGFGSPAVYMLASTIQQPDAPASQATRYNVAEARRLMAQAGYGNGVDVELLVSPTRPGPYAQELATLIQSQLARIGVRIKITVNASATEYQAALNTGKFQMSFYSSRPVINDPAYAIRLSFAKGGTSSGWTAYSNPQIDRLGELLITTRPGPRRNRLVASTQRILAADVPWIPIAETVITWVFRSNVSGARVTSFGVIYPQDLSKT